MKANNKPSILVLAVIVIVFACFGVHAYYSHLDTVNIIDIAEYKAKTIAHHKPSIYSDNQHIYSLWLNAPRRESIDFSVAKTPLDSATMLSTDVTITPFMITVSDESGEEIAACEYEKFNAHLPRYAFLDAIVRKVSVTVNYEAKAFKSYGGSHYQIEKRVQGIISDEIQKYFKEQLFPSVKNYTIENIPALTTAQLDTVFYVKFKNQKSLTNLNYQTDWAKVLISNKTMYAKCYEYTDPRNFYYDFGSSYTGEDFSSTKDLSDIIRK